MMRVNVVLFASYRELLGEQRMQLEVPNQTRVQEVFDLLAEQKPALAQLRDCTSFAVNREVQSPEFVLQPEDEVAFLQPVSGG